MGRLVYSYLASLDGYIADASGAFDWAEPDEQVLAFINELERGVSTYLYGRRIYEMMVVWETDPDLAASSPMSGEFAGIWQQADKVVFSRTMDEVATRRTRIEREFDRATVEAIKASVDGDLAVSGATLAAVAARLGLIDEVQVFLAPVVVGGGQRMFPDGVWQDLTLRDERRFDNGMVWLRYDVAPPAGTAS
ncbi:dihydrofolate reductase family protein [Demequina muriae]|uniref:Dihydrofolate reductase family protein n=1 Tax=Demequina muriae TaxID=3051664 RepID=A0ABT8GDY8_9MICO|nr:dihydrofolate reductase family protein [Demequina sp. EGI L300058]MDN4479642.1 dihydrofolate reductase family protein [Demequina sp. EGI L300058]